MQSVCHITNVHSRYDVRILYKECISLANAGLDVTLIVSDLKDEEKIYGVKIVSVQFSAKSRIERLLKSGRIIYEKAVNLNADVYHLHDPELIPIGLKLKRIGKKVIFDSHEDIPNDILDKKWIPKPFRSIIAKAYSTYEKISLKKLDAVISVTPHLTNRLKTINRNTFEITNYPLLRNTQKSENVEKAICFAGNIKREYNHHLILEAIERIEGVKYILAGHGDPKYIEELKQMDGWKHVEFLGQIPVNDVYDIYSRSLAGISVHQYSNNIGGKEGSRGIIKNYEFLMSELPIITTDFTIWKDIIEKYQCGICVNPDSVDEIVKAIKYIIDNPKIAKTMGINGRTAIEKEYNWSTQEPILINMYKCL